MSSSALKILAIICMTCSHIYSLLFPQYGGLYLIGRLAFPIFAWSVASGARHTHSIRDYLTRLFLLAIISQIPYVMVHRLTNPAFWELNVVFTLFSGLLAIAVLRTKRDAVLKSAAVIFIAACAELLLMDYGAVGVLSVVSFYLFNRRFAWLILAQAVLILGLLAYPAYEVMKAGQIYIHNLLYFGNVLSLLALPFIYLYNGKQGRDLKYFFYFYYPLHFIALYYAFIALL